MFNKKDLPARVRIEPIVIISDEITEAVFTKDIVEELLARVQSRIDQEFISILSSNDLEKKIVLPVFGFTYTTGS